MKVFLLSGSMFLAAANHTAFAAPQNHVVMTCVEQDSEDENDWWEVEISKTDDNQLNAKVIFADEDEDETEVLCEKTVSVTDSSSTTMTYESDNEEFYLHVKHIEDSSGYGKLWTDGCGYVRDLERVKMDCEIH